MNKRRWIAVAVFVALIIMQVMTHDTSPNTSIYSPSWNSGSSWNSGVYQEGGIDQIALLEAKGTIMESEETSMFTSVGYNHRMFLEQLEQAFSDPLIKGVVLYVDSPGGGVYESDEIYADIVQLKEQYQKPFVVYMGKTAASGGYYISAPADKIIANKNTITGSIGVVMSSLNIKGLLEKYGIKDQTFASGDNKTIMSPYQDMTEEQVAIIESIIDENYQTFVDIVASGRNMDRSRVLEIADGRIYTALQAQQVGLVDEIGDLEDAFAAAADLAGVSNPTIINYEGNDWMPFGGLFGKLSSLSRNIIYEKTGIQEIVPTYETPSFMYLWQW